MKVHLINPDEHRILENAGDRIPLGLLSIGASLEQANHEVRVFDLNHTKSEEYYAELEKDLPDAVGISVYTSPSVPEALELARNIKPMTRVIAGGYHATAMPETLTSEFDAVVVGEGESAMITALEEDGIIMGLNTNLESTPNPSRQLVDTTNYGMDQDGNRTATLITSRGCPYECAFCGKLSKKVRFEPTNKVREQIEQVESEGFNAIYFLDDVFSLWPSRMNQILQMSQLPKRVTTRANLVDKTRLAYMAGNNVEWLSMGIESGDDVILKMSNKGMTTRDNQLAVKLAHDYGIKTKGFFIIGLPGETEKSARQTIDYSLMLRDHGLNKADFYFLTPFPGTPIWKNPEQFGIEITDRDYTKYLEAGKNARCYVNTPGLKAGKIEELVQEAKSLW